MAENASGQHTALFYRSAEIETAPRDSTIRDVWPQKSGKYMLIKYRNGLKTKVPKDSVWGFRDRKGNVFRMYERVPYLVVENETYVKYHYETEIYIEPTFIPHTLSYFSETLDSPIKSSKKKLARK